LEASRQICKEGFDMGPDPAKLVQLKQHEKIMDSTYEAYVNAKKSGVAKKLEETKKLWNIAKKKHQDLLNSM